jgi:hypothetical protein
MFSQAGAEKVIAGIGAAASQKRMKQRTPRVDFRRVALQDVDFDVLACVRCGGRLKGLGGP